MSHYSDQAHMCRVDFWKPSGKWYVTESVDFFGLYDEELIHEAFKKALDRHFGGVKRLSGMRATCLQPYHKFEHPISLIVE